MNNTFPARFGTTLWEGSDRGRAGDSIQGETR